jgi:hypothetical protein
VIILLVHLHKLVVAVVANIVENHMHLVLNLIEANLAIAVADRIKLVAVEDKMETVVAVEDRMETVAAVEDKMEPVVADKLETVVEDSNIAVVVEMDC